MKAHILRVIRIIGGILLIALGIIGLVLPFLQGWLFIILGVLLIHPENGHKMKEKIKEYAAKFRAWAEKQNS